MMMIEIKRTTQAPIYTVFLDHEVRGHIYPHLGSDPDDAEWRYRPRHEPGHTLEHSDLRALVDKVLLNP